MQLGSSKDLSQPLSKSKRRKNKSNQTWLKQPITWKV